MSFILGLDVGTASGAGATKRDGRVQPCALGDRTATLPAVVVLHDDGTALIGEEAERIAGLELTRVARDLRYDPVLQTTPIKVGGEIHTPHELLRTLYASMVQRVSATHGASPTHVVLTHPALPEGMRCETVDRIADELFPGALVVPEPVAATVKLACDGVLPADCLVAVYDFGGGTFDTTLVQRDGDRFSVIGDPAGLGDFGGIDIDDLVLDHVDRSLDGAIARLDMSDPASITALTRLRAECRDAKERLSYDTEVTIDASLPHLPALVQLTRAEFEDIIRPRLETTVDVMLDMLDRAGFRPSEVDAVALVGGSSRIPAVVDLLAARTTMQVLVDPYPELTVALGAAQMVDDEVSSSSVFPLADMALPSLGSLGGAGAGAGLGAGAVGAGATGLMEPATGPVGPPGGSGMGHNVGTAVDPPPGAHMGAAAGGYDETNVEAFDMFGRPDPAYGGPGGRGGRPPMSVEEEAFGAGLGETSGSSLSDRLGGLNPQKGLVVLACFLAVLLFGGIIVALTSGGGGDDGDPTTVPGSSLVDETAGTVTDPDTSTSSTPSSSSSSSSTSTTAADGEDEGDPAVPPVDPPTTDDDGGPSSPGTTPTTRPSTPTTRPSTPTTRPAPTTTSTTTTSTTTTTTTTTTVPDPPAQTGDAMAPALREDPPTE